MDILKDYIPASKKGYKKPFLSGKAFNLYQIFLRGYAGPGRADLGAGTAVLAQVGVDDVLGVAG